MSRSVTSRGGRLHSVSFASDAGIEGLLLHQRPAVERIAWTAQCDDLIVIALLDAALDDDRTGFRECGRAQ